MQSRARTRAGNDAPRTPSVHPRPVRRTILIVDDHPAFRSSARLMLQAEGFDVVGEAADGTTALDQIRRLRPQIVLLDVRLPDISGLAVAEELSRWRGGPDVVLVSSRERDPRIPVVQDHLARGFLPKADLTGETLRSLLVAR